MEKIIEAGLGRNLRLDGYKVGYDAGSRVALSGQTLRASA